MKIFYVFVFILGAAALTLADHDAELKLARSKCFGDRDLPLCTDASIKKAVKKLPALDCQRCRVEQLARSISPKGDDTCIPECQKTAGKQEWFKPMQKCGKEVWCVDKYGHEIKGSRKVATTLDCAPFLKKAPKPKTQCELDAAEAVKNNKKYIPTCHTAGKMKGYHTAIQCYGTGKVKTWCWCSFANGNFLAGTFYKNGAKNPPNCAAHYNAVYNCKGHLGLKSHPFECDRYVSCGQTVYSCRCSPGQHFNPKALVCDWAANVKCPKKP